MLRSVCVDRSPGISVEEGIEITRQPPGRRRLRALLRLVRNPVLILDSAVKERYVTRAISRGAGLTAHVVLGLDRLALTQKRWQEAQDFYRKVLEKYPDIKPVAEAP